tara:strand:+ start:3673 stop:4809 length:1137 start_codon:yes stop_codon:yes gene_type:complete
METELKNRSIEVTRPYLPELEEFLPYLEKIWENKSLTNNGPFHTQLESALASYLDVPYVSLFSNGTLALVSALQALRISGEVITTPYSFVATSHSLLWNSIRPVFVDIEPHTLNINPEKIEAAITPQTTAILPVHCYGNPCSVGEIKRIADINNLKIIYDAAHAFGVKDKTRSILNYGDISILSFHATKVFNTFEGGAIICHDRNMKRRIDNLKNFGFVDETTVEVAGINAKMSEFNAALGLLQLKHVDDAINKRKLIFEKYIDALSSIVGITYIPQIAAKSNYSYFPILVNNSFALNRDNLYKKLKTNGINARRYFYPLITDFPMYREHASARKDNLPVANTSANNVLCLPIYPELEKEDQEHIINTILSCAQTDFN